ncbi:uncharacterized protein L201_006079 [Kwoniella dendrophila CBS 6074]|uniref:Uracil-DNA glycosylase-like domain-containing protein n=1 Tax=Kwoniella dendrophila CBS 6074 TaxID=1295534 RepID=A0AAX4K328_9TREE
MPKKEKEEEISIPSPASKAFANHLSKYAYSTSTLPSKLAGPTRITRSSVSVSPSKARIPVVEIPLSPRKKRNFFVEDIQTAKKVTSKKRGRRSLESDNDQDYDDALNSLDESEYEESPSKIKTEKSPNKIKKGKRTKEMNDDGEEIVVKKKGKIPRGYAPPETYEHLKPVNDLMKDDMDSKRSSTMGHHFSHPTNKYWRSLHQSGLTPRLLDPTEDYLMLDYGYGLTNLVDRPTSEQSELSTLEMKLNVYNLTRKFLKYKPKLVCFVGKKIWDVYESVVVKASNPIENGSIKPVDTEDGEGSQQSLIKLEEDQANIKAELMSAEEHVKLETVQDRDEESSLSPIPPTSITSIQETDDKTFDVKLEPVDDQTSTMTDPSSSDQKPSMYYITEAVPDQNNIQTVSPQKKKKSPRKKILMEPFNATKPRKFRLPHYNPNSTSKGKSVVIGYTYFWVVPNTSGLERTQLPEQIVNFTALREFLEELKNGFNPSKEEQFDDGLLRIRWRDIDHQGVERTVEEIMKAASAK